MQTRLPDLLFSFLFVFGFTFLGNAQNELDWQWQNPSPTGNDLRDVQFIDAQNGGSVGKLGTILKTTNGGQIWQVQNSGTRKTLNSLHFTNVQTGWVVGELGTILKTSNGGQIWQAQNSGTTRDLNSLYFSDAQTGWMVGGSGTILKTSNGGQAWLVQSSGTTNNLRSVYFIDSQTGWVVAGNGTIRKTSNGGQTWLAQNSGTSLALWSVHFTDPQTGWAVGDYGIILKTSNSGLSWQTQTSGTTNDLRSVQFSNSQTGLAVGMDGKILKTSNGGQTWQAGSGGTLNWFYSVHFSDAQTGWTVGDFGTILKTSNGGQTWQGQRRGSINSLHSVHFSNALTGWAVGDYGTILKTSNGGQSWQTQPSPTLNRILAIQFYNDQIGWAVGQFGLTINTTNGGQNWQNPGNTGIPYHLHSVHFNDAQTGWAVGAFGTILKTTNGSLTWQPQNSGTTNILYSVHFTDAQTGWAVGENGTILKTNNGGQTWQAQSSGTTKHLLSVHYSNAQTGWAVGIVGTILKTSNGGQSWQTQSSGTTNILYSAHFSDSQNGWVVGTNGTILKTSNGGQSWQPQNSGTTNILNSVHFTDAQTGWAVGDAGTILHYQGVLSPEVPVSLLGGKLFEKNGSDCNNTSIGVPYGMVKAMPGPYYGVAKLDGNYSLRVPLADTATNFTLSPLGFYSSAFQSTTVCPPSGQISITVDTIPDTLSGNNFGFEITPCHHLDVQLSSNRRRRCFVNTTSVSYVNQGSLAAPNAYVLVEFPHWVKPVRASRSYVAVNDSVWRFNLDTVSAGEYGAFTITDSVLCGDVGVLGLSQCTKATIFPAPDCPPNSNWSGAEISVSGKCHNGFVELGIYNKTSTPMPDSVDYWVYLDSIQVKQAKVKLAAGDSLKLWVEAFGMPVYLTVNQVANHPSDLFVATSIEACNDTMPFYPRPAATRFPIAQRPNSKTQCLPIIGAYDPNDKQVFPIGFTNQNIIAPNTRLEYLVRFQNTGNDTAFTVFVIDTIDQNLNVESFEMGAASHPFELSMQTTKSGKTFLRWQFNNILLPDSNTNEPASNGFIQFRISPKPGLSLGSKVRNHAEIYFDFNPPIITNQTLTTYDVIVFRDSTLNGNVQIITSAEKQLEQQLGVKLYPNPVTQNRLTVSFAATGSLTLFDAKGRIVFQKENILGTETLPVSLKPGFYFAQIQTPKGRQHVKVVVE